jgi:hypothetical protein
VVAVDEDRPFDGGVDPGRARHHRSLARDVGLAALARRVEVLLHDRVRGVEGRDRLVVLVRQDHRHEGIKRLLARHPRA